MKQYNGSMTWKCQKLVSPDRLGSNELWGPICDIIGNGIVDHLDNELEEVFYETVFYLSSPITSGRKIV